MYLDAVPSLSYLSPPFTKIYFISKWLDFRVNITRLAIRPKFVPCQTHSRTLNLAHRPAREPLLLEPASVA